MAVHNGYFFIGFLAQGMFSARMIFQWLLSEKAKKTVSPSIYWKLSLAGSFTLSLYGWLRGDFAIILGQVFSYYIYVWNLDIKGSWKKMDRIVRSVILSMPLAAIVYMIIKGWESSLRLFGHLPEWLIIFGSAGQMLFTLRFLYQWWYSRKRKKSFLPPAFWKLSLSGSLLIVLYGILRKDPVLIIGQSIGFITYSRNLYIGVKYNKKA